MHQPDPKNPKYVTCPDCKGKGDMKARPGVDADRETCETCMGHGEVCDQCFAPPQTPVGMDGDTRGGCFHHY